MLGLSATSTARRQLKDLRTSNPDLFALVRERIEEIRADPGGPARGRVFVLDDGTSARLATFYDHRAGKDLAVIWKVEPTVDTDPSTLILIRAEHV